MAAPEEVDEINEYLKQRHVRQEKGELPKSDYTPSLLKKLKRAIWGKEPEIHTLLMAEQPTSASPEADAAMRKQIEQVVQSRVNQSPPAPFTNAPPVTTPALPKAPYASPSNSPIKVSAYIPESKPSPFAKFSQIQNEMNRGSTTPPVPEKKEMEPIHWSTVSNTEEPKTDSPYSSVAPATPSASPQFESIPPRATPDISPVSSSKPITIIETPPKRVSSYNYIVPGTSPTTASDAPPWVSRRTAQSPDMRGIGELNRAAKENAFPWSTSRVGEPKPANESRPASTFTSSKKFAYNDPDKKQNSFTMPSPVPTPEKKLFTPAPTPPLEKSPALKPWVSGEINVEKEIEKPLPSPTAIEKIDEIKEEEITEEEALEQLPFEDVEGLSQSDLDYLEKKEQEHREQRKKLEEDTITPEELRDRLRKQEERMQNVLNKEFPRTPAQTPKPASQPIPLSAPRETPRPSYTAPPYPRPTPPKQTPPVASASASPNPNEKEEILRRLKKMMEDGENSS